MRLPCVHAADDTARRMAYVLEADLETEANNSPTQRLYSRIRYGDEGGVAGAKSTLCPDCDVVAGEHHIYGCVVEQCPICGGSVSNCECRCERLGE